MLINRRNFLKVGSLASASLLMPNFLKALTHENAITERQNILVVLQFSGGNDGLNTIIPVKNDLYYKNRTNISIKNPLLLNDEAAINPALEYFKTLYDNGELAILNEVGYPNPDKSHFRSMDIWQSASRSDEFLQTGWIGRFLDEACHNCAHPTQALEIDDMLSLAMKGKNQKAIALKNPDRLYQSSREDFYKNLYKNHGHEDETANYLYQTLGDTLSSAQYIFEESKVKKSNFAYPNSQIGKDFKTISSLIQSDINTQVYYLQIGSFDTHINQNQRQTQLFSQINDAVKAFVEDLKQNGLFNNTMIMTFSEFGRRVTENASNGTDHGTANQMFFISGGLRKKGVLNALPNLENLNEGDLIYSEDFRKVYATVLKNWLKTDPGKILGADNGLYDFI